MGSATEGEISCNAPAAFRRDAVLWISNSAFQPGFDHKWIEIRSEVGARRESVYWQQVAASQLDPEIPGGLDHADLAPTLSLGTLYRSTKEEQPDAKICLLRLKIREPNQTVNACLNPLVLSFSNQQGSKLSTEFQQFRESSYLLDVHVSFPAGDIPRALLHTVLHRRSVEGGAIGPDAPAIPQLLFGQSADVGALPFLLLDAFEGTFLLEGLSSGSARWLWYAASELAPNNLWLAEYCLKRLGVTVQQAGPAGEPLEVSGVEKGARGEKDVQQWSDGTLREALEAARLPHAVVEVALREPEQFSLRLKGCIRSGRLHTFAFCDALGSLLLPQSNIRAGFPEPPSWMGEASIERWQQRRSRYQLDLRKTPLAAVEWWLSFLGQAESAMDADTVAWWVDRSWYWPFYGSLFRRQPHYRVRWERPRDKAGLGLSRLGALVLGAAEFPANQDLFPGIDSFQLLAAGEL